MDWDEMLKKIDHNKLDRILTLNKLPNGSRIEYKDRIYIKTNLTPFYCDIDNGDMVKVEHLLDGLIVRKGEG